MAVSLEHPLVFGIDWIERPGEPALQQVAEDASANRVRPLAGAEYDNGTRREQMIQEM
jgi:hypothetical protein